MKQYDFFRDPTQNIRWVFRTNYYWLKIMKEKKIIGSYIWRCLYLKVKYFLISWHFFLKLTVFFSELWKKNGWKNKAKFNFDENLIMLKLTIIVLFWSNILNFQLKVFLWKKLSSILWVWSNISFKNDWNFYFELF